jgi:hypothetical protein
MTKNDFGPLGTVDILTSSELKDTLGHQMSHTIREWFRGIDYTGTAGPGNGTGLIQIPAAEQGYTWSVRLVSAQLSAAGSLSVYPGDATNSAPVGVMASVPNGTLNEVVIQWASEALVIKDGRTLTLVSAVTILNWRVLAKQVPTEMQGKL